MFSPSLIPLYTCVCQGTGSFYSHRTSKEDHVLLPVQVYKAPTYTATHRHRSYFYSRSGKGTCPFQIKKYSHFCSLQPTPRSTEKRSLFITPNPQQRQHTAIPLPSHFIQIAVKQPIQKFKGRTTTTPSFCPSYSHESYFLSRIPAI